MFQTIPLDKVKTKEKNNLISARLRHPCVQITGNEASTHLVSQGRDYAVLSNLILDPDKKDVYEWSLLLKDVQGWTIYVGICLESFSEKYGIVISNWSSLKEGGYFISSWSGTCYTAHNDTIVKKGTNKFQDHERIYFKYVTKERLLTIYKKNGQNIVENGVWEYKVLPPPYGQHYRPAATLWRGCSIQFQAQQ